MIKNRKVGIVHCLDFGIIGGHCTVSMGFTYDELIKVFKRQKLTTWIEGIADDKEFLSSVEYVALHRKVKNIDLYYIFFKDHFDFSDDAYTFLAHEITHICQFLLWPRITGREHEFEAYMHTHLMKQTLAALRNIKAKKA